MAGYSDLMINLIPLPEDFSIHQLDCNQKIPPQIFESGYCSVTKTNDEISIVTDCKADFKSLKSNRDWKGFKVEGILDFSEIGIIHDITKPLKDNYISVFVISTFNTDYIFVKKESFERAIEILKMVKNINISDQ